MHRLKSKGLRMDPPKTSDYEFTVARFIEPRMARSSKWAHQVFVLRRHI